MNLDQEELINIKAIARLMPESQARNHIFLLLAHIDAQAGQIGALKERLTETTARQLDVICKYDDMEGRCTMGDTGWCNGCKQKDRMRALARKQLAEDEKLKSAGVTWK